MQKSTKKTKNVLQLLRDYESRNITFMEADGSWPIVWERAKGVHVWDADGKKYLDLTAAFGVAAAGHANSNVVKAGATQMKTLLHAMGDVHPHARKAELARELSKLTFERWSGGRGKIIFCNSGFEAVEAAFKTAMLSTGKQGVIAFRGAYHGLGYGALNATHREHFRTSFRSQLRQFAEFAPFPKTLEDLENTKTILQKIFRNKKIGAVVVEPIQARGGINIPPAPFLPMLRELCDQHGALLILDEIYTGFGRTGKWFACEHSGVVPDIICLGKALTGGFPLSTCVGKAEVMDDAWPASIGEAIHTSTYLGHPVGCAMALAQIEEIKRNKLVERSAKMGKFLLESVVDPLSPAARKKTPSLPLPTTSRQHFYVGNLAISLRGQGLMIGVELLRKDGSPAMKESLAAIKTLLHRGFIFLPEGEHANIIGFTPPLTISEKQLQLAMKELIKSLSNC